MRAGAAGAVHAAVEVVIVEGTVQNVLAGTAGGPVLFPVSPESVRTPAQALSRMRFADTVLLLPVVPPTQNESRCMADWALLKMVFLVIVFALVQTSMASLFVVPMILLAVTVTISPTLAVSVKSEIAVLLFPSVLPETEVELFSTVSKSKMSVD